MTTKNNFKSGLMFLLVGTSVLVLDQATKSWVMHSFDLYQQITVIPSFLNIVHVTNTGAAFGFMAGQEKWRHLFFQVISVMALCGLFYVYITAQKKTRRFFWGCSMIFGGACGNLVDRLRFGHVVDFMDFHVGTYHWPAFNVADSAITIGGIMLALHFLRFTDQ